MATDGQRSIPFDNRAKWANTLEEITYKTKSGKTRRNWRKLYDNEIQKKKRF